MAKIDIQTKVQEAVKETYSETLWAQIHRAEILVAVGKKIGLSANPSVTSLDTVLKTLSGKSLRGEKATEFINKVDELNRVIIEHIRKTHTTNTTIKAEFSKYIDKEVQDYINEVVTFLDTTPLKDYKGDVVKWIRDQITELKKAVETVWTVAVWVPGTAWWELSKHALPQYGVENLDVTFSSFGTNIPSKLANSDWFWSTRKSILKMMDESVGKEWDATYLEYLIRNGKNATIATPFSANAHEFITALKERLENGSSLESRKWDAVIRRIDPKSGLDIEMIRRNLSTFTGAIDKIESEVKRELDDPKKYIELDFGGRKKRIPENGEFVSRMEKVLFLNTTLQLMKGAFQDVEHNNFAFWVEALQAFTLPTTFIDLWVAINAILALIFNPFTAGALHRMSTVSPRASGRQSLDKFQDKLDILSLEEIEKAEAAKPEFPEALKDMPEKFKERLIIVSKLYHYFDTIWLDDVKSSMRELLSSGGFKTHGHDFFGTDARFYSKIVDVLHQHLIAQNKNPIVKGLAKAQLRARYYLLARYRYIFRATWLTRIHIGVDGPHPSAERAWTRLPENMKKMVGNVVDDMYTFINDGVDKDARNALRDRAKARLETQQIHDGSGMRPYTEVEKVALRARMDAFIDNIDASERSNKWWVSHVLESIVENASEDDVRRIIDEGIMPDETRQNALKKTYELTSAAATATEKLRFEIQKELDKFKTGALYTAHAGEIDQIVNALNRQFANTPEDKLEAFKNEKIAVVKEALTHISELKSHFQSHQARLIELLKEAVNSWKWLSDIEKIAKTVDAIENRVWVKVDASRTEVLNEIRGIVGRWLSLSKMWEITASFPSDTDAAAFNETIDKLVETAKLRDTLTKKVAPLPASDIRTALEEEIKKMKHENRVQVEKLVSEVTSMLEKVETLKKVVIEWNETKLASLMDAVVERIKKLSSKNIETSPFGSIFKEIVGIIDGVSKLDKSFKYDAASPHASNIPGRIIDMVQKIIANSQNASDFWSIKELVLTLESLEESFWKKAGAPAEAREAMVRKVEEILRTQWVSWIDAIRKLNADIDAQFWVEEQKAEVRKKLTDPTSELTATQKKELLDMLESYKTTTTVEVDKINTLIEQLSSLAKSIKADIEIAGVTESTDLKNKLTADFQNIKVTEVKEFKERVEKIVEIVENLKKVGTGFGASRSHILSDITSRRSRLSELQTLSDIVKQVVSISNSIAAETTMHNEIKEALYKKVEASVKSPNAQVELAEIISTEIPKVVKLIPYIIKLDVPAGIDGEVAAEARTYIDTLKANIISQILSWIQTRGDDVTTRLENIMISQDLNWLLKKVFDIGSIHIWEVEIDATEIIKKSLWDYIQMANKEGVALISNGINELETLRSQVATLEGEIGRWQEIIDNGGKVNKPIPNINAIKERLVRAFSGGKVAWREVSEVLRMVWSASSDLKTLKVTQEPRKLVPPTVPVEKFDFADGIESKAYKMLKWLELHFESIWDVDASNKIEWIIWKLANAETVDWISTENMSAFKESLVRTLGLAWEFPTLESVEAQIKELDGVKYHARGFSVDELTRINSLEEAARKTEILRLENEGKIRRVLRKL